MNTVYLRVELVRLLRNRRLLIFSVLMPSLLLFIIGNTTKGGDVNGVSATAYIMVSMGIYGAMTAAIGSGGTIAVERGLGWNRQLRLTPLNPGRYVLTKLLLALLLAIPPLLVTYAVGVLALDVRLSADVWAQVFLGSWLGAVPFAALGVVIGYVAKPDSVQQVSGLLYMLLAVFGGLWVPIEAMPHLMRVIADYTPAYWAGKVARGPLFHGELEARSVVVLLVWAVALGLLALRRFRTDTARA